MACSTPQRSPSAVNSAVLVPLRSARARSPRRAPAWCGWSARPPPPLVADARGSAGAGPAGPPRWQRPRGEQVGREARNHRGRGGGGVAGRGRAVHRARRRAAWRSPASQAAARGTASPQREAEVDAAALAGLPRRTQYQARSRPGQRRRGVRSVCSSAARRLAVSASRRRSHSAGLGAAQVGLLGEIGVVGVVPALAGRSRRLAQPFEAVGRDRLQQPVARRAARRRGSATSGAVDRAGIEHVRGRHTASAASSVQPSAWTARRAAGRASAPVEQVPAPVDHRAQGPLPRRARRGARRPAAGTGRRAGRPARARRAPAPGSRPAPAPAGCRPAGGTAPRPPAAVSRRG